MAWDGPAYQCICAGDWTGRHCDQPPTCGAGESFNIVTGLCEQIDECAPKPCGAPYRGTCADGINAYTCTCNTGWEGTNCATAKACTSNGAGTSVAYACVNGGTISGVTSDSANADANCACTCTTGWQGDHCDENINECGNVVDVTFGGGPPKSVQAIQYA